MKTNDLASILQKNKNIDINSHAKQFELANKLKDNASKFDKADSAMGVATEGETKIVKKSVPTVKAVFTLPEDELSIIDEVVERVLRQGRAIHKSHIIRIGIQLANRLSSKELLDELSKIEIRKVGKHLN